MIYLPGLQKWERYARQGAPIATIPVPKNPSPKAFQQLCSGLETVAQLQSCVQEQHRAHGWGT